MINLYQLLAIHPDANANIIQAALNAKREQLSAKEIKAVEEWLLVPDVRFRYDAKLRETYPDFFAAAQIHSHSVPQQEIAHSTQEKPKIVPLNDETANDDDYIDLPPMWNPKVAFWVSILMNVVVGAVIHAINWKHLGEEKLAKENQMWAIGGVIAIFIGMLFSSNGGSLGINLALVVAWYYSVGKKQVTFFEENFNNDYEKRGWALPVVYAIVAALVLAFIAIIMAGVLGL